MSRYLAHSEDLSPRLEVAGDRTFKAHSMEGPEALLQRTALLPVRPVGASYLWGKFTFSTAFTCGRIRTWMMRDERHLPLLDCEGKQHPYGSILSPY